MLDFLKEILYPDVPEEIADGTKGKISSKAKKLIREKPEELLHKSLWDGKQKIELDGETYIIE